MPKTAALTKAERKRAASAAYRRLHGHPERKPGYQPAIVRLTDAVGWPPLGPRRRLETPRQAAAMISRHFSWGDEDA